MKRTTVYGYCSRTHEVGVYGVKTFIKNYSKLIEKRIRAQKYKDRKKHRHFI